MSIFSRAGLVQVVRRGSTWKGGWDPNSPDQEACTEQEIRVCTVSGEAVNTSVWQEHGM